MKPYLPDVTPVQLDELRAIYRNEDHAKRPGPRNAVRDRLRDMGLVEWWVDGLANEFRNYSKWQLTARGFDTMVKHEAPSAAKTGKEG